ncbi:MAG TPA: XrtA/PEP-CTERM system amidotransferase [Rhizomicrobium sp.]|nr:XrtA/PEP-CTERM system amidotransferase [Rhizomicrobium sp.]
MCGIAGLFDTKGHRSFDTSLIGRMTDAVAHRGPDGSGIHSEPGLALGHRRLSIIDLAGGVQPMRTADGAVTVIFNGEIYNFRELRAELESLGCRFATQSDTEVLLHGWRRWRQDLPRRLRGLFAFALWDSVEQTLFLARDPFGKKPLHYSALPDGTLVFGSEIKSLLLHPDVDRSLEPTAVEDFFAFGYVPDPKSIYRSIRKLPPAHSLTVQRGRPLALRCYWNVLDGVHRPRRGEDLAAELIERLRGAVQSRLISDVPLGALLSGGVDSSAVVALMRLPGGEPVNTFSIAFADRAFDESSYANAVAERYGTRHVVREVDPDNFSLLPRLPEIYDEPFGDISAIPTFFVCAEARKSVTVALTGDGGDEALAGYRRYAFHAAEEKLRARMPRGLRRRALGALADVYPTASWLPRPLRAKATLRELSLDAADAYVRMVSALPLEMRVELLSPEFRRSLGGYDAGETVRAHFNVEAPLDPIQRAQYADVMTYLPGDILTKVDRASMANSLELRAPFLDPELFSWSLSLGPEQKLSKHGGKAILKRAMEPYLPREILYRPKQGFTVPLARWFRGPLKENIRALSQSARLIESGFLDVRRVEEMAQSHIHGWSDYSKPLWLVWAFDAFLGHRSRHAGS